MSNKVVISEPQPNKVTVNTSTTITVSQVAPNSRVVYV
jgi:hypothetical protein